MNLKFVAAMLAVLLVLTPAAAQTQPNHKPYRVSASGQKIFIRTDKPIRNLMVWSGSGHRILEQKNINLTNYQLTPPRGEKYFFVMLQLADGKVYTEKIGVLR
ncbi:MAG TPA: hypothetical protein VEB63_12235 [Chitinophagaceae bacterium]|nr:hypothetical protein [Chitinophagaceae bacterium]